MAAWIHSDNTETLSRLVAARRADMRKGLALAKHKGAKAAATLTLRDYRDETEAALDRMIEVMCAHEAEILALRRQVSELSDRLPR